MTIEDREQIHHEIKRIFDENLSSIIEPIEVKSLCKGSIFADFHDSKAENKLYQEINDFEHIHTVVENYLEDYNIMSKTQMDLVIFR